MNALLLTLFGCYVEDDTPGRQAMTKTAKQHFDDLFPENEL